MPNMKIQEPRYKIPCQDLFEKNKMDISKI